MAVNPDPPNKSSSPMRLSVADSLVVNGDKSLSSQSDKSTSSSPPFVKAFLLSAADPTNSPDNPSPSNKSLLSSSSANKSSKSASVSAFINVSPGSLSLNSESQSKSSSVAVMEGVSSSPNHSDVSLLNSSLLLSSSSLSIQSNESMSLSNSLLVEFAVEAGVFVLSNSSVFDSVKVSSQSLSWSNSSKRLSKSSESEVSSITLSTLEFISNSQSLESSTSSRGGGGIAAYINFVEPICTNGNCIILYIYVCFLINFNQNLF